MPAPRCRERGKRELRAIVAVEEPSAQPGTGTCEQPERQELERDEGCYFVHGDFTLAR
jgi:hypothetical protein